MNPDIERIIEKVKKCLALSASDNPHEAARALQQAQALMKKHGLHESDLNAIEVTTVDVEENSANGRRPPGWETMVVEIVGRAFGCKAMFAFARRSIHGGRATGTYRYVGACSNAAIAAHTATVLLRQVHKARLAHSRQLKKEAREEGWVPTRQEVNAAADAFSLGWTTAVREQVIAFANPDHVDREISRVYQQATGGRVAKPTRLKVHSFDSASVADGVRAGNEVRLHRPVTGTGQATLALPAPASQAGC